MSCCAVVVCEDIRGARDSPPGAENEAPDASLVSLLIAF
jgi:hypothetical protein